MLLMLPGGWLIDRIGPRAALTWMGLGMGLLVMLTGVLGLLDLAGAELWLGLVVVRSLAGATSVPLHPAAASMVARWFGPASRSTANGLVTAAALLGIALTYPVFGWLIDRLGWPQAFVAAGLATALYALVWNRTTADDPPQTAAFDGPELINPQPEGVVMLLRNRSLVLLTLSYAALGYFQYLFFYWMQYYFESALEWGKADSRRAAFVVMISMAAGMAVGGWLADRLCLVLGATAGRRAIGVVGMGASALLALAGVNAGEPRGVIVWFSLATASLGLCEGVFWTTATALAERNRGLACALVNTLGNAGGALAPTLTPLLAEHYGWTTTIGVACAVCGAGGLLWLGIVENRANAA